MKCPFCGYADTRVIDSRPTDDQSKIRRRRECTNCENRFTTYEVVETVPMMVIKNDGSRELFDREKLMNGLVRACVKRSIPIETLDTVVDKVEQALLNSMQREVPTSKIGELAMEQLKDIDEVAYVRFASVYRRFEDIDTFREELEELMKTK